MESCRFGAINPVIRLAMLVCDGNHDCPLYPDDVKHLVRKTIKYKTSYWLDFDLPSERAFLNEPSSRLRLVLKRLSQPLLLPIVKALCLCQLVARKCQENQRHYK